MQEAAADRAAALPSSARCHQPACVTQESCKIATPRLRSDTFVSSRNLQTRLAAECPSVRIGTRSYAVSRAQLQQLLNNLLELGPRRLMALGLIGFAVLVTVVGGAYYLSRPEFESLYTGLDREDVTRIGAALREAEHHLRCQRGRRCGLGAPGQTAQARMLLAEKGLPHQRQCRLRAVRQDRLARPDLLHAGGHASCARSRASSRAPIQTMSGVKAARVHIVMPVTRLVPRARSSRPPHRWCMRTDGADERGTAQAIRHLVAAAIPGMTRDKVTVLNADGRCCWPGGRGQTPRRPDGEPREDGLQA